VEWKDERSNIQAERLELKSEACRERGCQHGRTMKKEVASDRTGVAARRVDNFPYILVVCKHYPAGA